MKILRKIIVLSATIACSSTFLSAETLNAEELFKNKCAICHSMTQPTDKSKMLAPPAKGVMFHMSEAFDSNEKIKAHILDFVLEPTKEKAICKSVKRFGVMPSQKGNVTKEELSIIADWMLENLKMNKEQHKKMENEKHKDMQHKDMKK